jgi:hypothetical protein
MRVSRWLILLHFALITITVFGQPAPSLLFLHIVDEYRQGGMCQPRVRTHSYGTVHTVFNQIDDVAEGFHGICGSARIVSIGISGFIG